MRASTVLLVLASCGPAGFAPAGFDPTGNGDDHGAWGGAGRDDDPDDVVGGGPKVERCGNSVDDDFDGLVDDGCACERDASQDCWIGPRFAREQGICHAGRQVCVAGSDGTLGWGPCEGVQLPLDEDCGNGADDDCDERPDCEDPDCAGACGGGCASEELACRDGADDDCDGATDCDDEDCAASCAGCQEYEWDCDDGLDDDCNGDTDCEDIGCETSCRGQQEEEEQPEEVEPQEDEDEEVPDDGGGGERCNGVDDDGDGRIDEGRVCGQADDGDGGGECVPGALRICDAYCGVHQRCDADGSWGACLVDALCAGVVACNEHADCPRGDWCDFGWCVAGTMGGWPCEDDAGCGASSWCAVEQGVCVLDCLHHGDCGEGLVCDLGECVADPYVPGGC